MASYVCNMPGMVQGFPIRYSAWELCKARLCLISFKLFLSGKLSQVTFQSSKFKEKFIHVVMLVICYELLSCDCDRASSSGWPILWILSFLYGCGGQDVY